MLGFSSRFKVLVFLGSQVKVLKIGVWECRVSKFMCWAS